MTTIQTEVHQVDMDTGQKTTAYRVADREGLSWVGDDNFFRGLRVPKSGISAAKTYIFAFWCRHYLTSSMPPLR